MTVTQSTSESNLELRYVTIGVLTALKEEYSACRSVFDPDLQGVEVERRTTAGALTCWLCFIPAKHGGKHVVAITQLPQMGNTAAAIAANILLQHCEGITALIMCGIAGAVPHPGDPEKHVRLGDIVVSGPPGIVQYDFGKQRDPRRVKRDVFRGFEFRAPLRPPCQRLLAAVTRIHADEISLLRRSDPRDWERKAKTFLQKVGNTAYWKRPGLATDRLVDTPDGKGKPIKHPKDDARRGRNPRVFHGAIGAANIVLADPKKRDALRERCQLRAIEMEGSGVADASWVANVGYLVIRGTCDYCNSTKNDIWHPYAAAIAAAYTRTVIEYLHADSVEQQEPLPSNVPIQTTAAPRSGAASTPPKIGVPSLPSDPVASLVEHAEAGRLKYEPALESPTIPPLVASDAGLNIALAQVSGFQPSAPADRRIQDLNEQINVLLENGDWKRTSPVAGELEKLLEKTSREGAVVRKGWLLLAKIEVARLRSEVEPGCKPDITRLTYLRTEAERVVV